MRKKLLFLLWLVAVIANASVIRNVSLHYNIDDFVVDVDDSNIARFGSPKHFLFYESDTTGIGLPFLMVDIRISKNESMSGVSIQCSDNVVSENVLIECNPLTVISGSNVNYVTRLFQGSQEQCPTSPVILMGDDVVDTCKILHFKVFPFLYDTYVNELRFVESIELELDLEENNAIAANASLSGNGDNSIMSGGSGGPWTGDRWDEDPQRRDTTPYEYVIITTEELAPSFSALATWKKTKGITAKVETIEYIDDEYTNSTLQEKIRQYIQLMARYNATQYVLLGGDETVVPVQGCFGIVGSAGVRDNEIPTDLFYACPYNDWDSNRNGVYGEQEDSLNFYTDVYVTRALVNNAEDAQNFCSKIVSYERNPTIGQWPNKMLMSGATLADGVSGAMKSFLIARDYIAPYWSGNVDFLFDDYLYGDVITGRLLTDEVLSEQLARGYNFVSLQCHGTPTNWWLTQYPNMADEYYYGLVDAQEQANSNYSVVSTTACETNRFDLEAPCLSETLLNNPNAKVLSYWGSSRVGLTYESSQNLGASDNYEGAFYQSIFTSNDKERSYGRVATKAKEQFANISKYNDEYRWLQYAINPIGDPEMPIYIQAPKSFGTRSSFLSQIYIGDRLTINSTVDSCRICVMSLDDDGESYYEVVDNVQSYTFNDVSGNLSVCITKPGYEPLIKLYTQRDLGGQFPGDIIISVAPGTGNATVGLVVSSEGTSVIKVSDMNGNPEREISIPSGAGYLEETITGLRRGSHLISLIVNGAAVDTKTANIR